MALYIIKQVDEKILLFLLNLQLPIEVIAVFKESFIKCIHCCIVIVLLTSRKLQLSGS